MTNVYSRIAGTGSYLPKKVLSNDDLAKMVDTNDEWIFTRTGMKERHIAADDEPVSALAEKASIQALKAAGIKAQDLDLIILATTTPDNTFPATACRVQALLGATCPAFDVQAVCSGFTYALTIADAMMKSSGYRRALVIGAETISKLIDWKDRSTCVLFGDGAGAVVLEATDRKTGILSTRLETDGSFYDILRTSGGPGTTGTAGHVLMDGKEVFRLAVTKLPEIAKATLAAAGITTEQLDWFIPHQANIRIIDAAMKHLNIAPHKVIKTIEVQANTSAASIGVSLDIAVREGRIKRGDKVLLTAMGGGFTLGALALEY